MAFNKIVIIHFPYRTSHRNRTFSSLLDLFYILQNGLCSLPSSFIHFGYDYLYLCKRKDENENCNVISEVEFVIKFDPDRSS